MLTLSETDWLKLVRANGLGPRTLLPLLKQSNSLEELLRLATPAVSEKLQLALKSADNALLEKDLAWLDSDDNQLITVAQEHYPQLLKTIDDPPLVLFARGNADLLTMPQLAVVGSRNPTKNGKDNAFAFSRYLSESGLTITSGMAMGIDTQAHKGALQGSGNTIAVIGTGPDRVYPASNRQLAHDIAEKGLLISEFPPGTAPHASHFPRRNRIISGLTLGTLVVEATERSGSLITANLASAQGREVFAIPGSIHNQQSRGCHKLIKQGAKLVEQGADIIDELGSLFGLLHEKDSCAQPKTQNEAGSDPSLDSQYQDLLENMGWDAISIQELVDNSGQKPEILSSMLLLLELQGHVSSAPGGYYIRTQPKEMVK